MPVGVQRKIILGDQSANSAICRIPELLSSRCQFLAPSALSDQQWIDAVGVPPINT